MWCRWGLGTYSLEVAGHVLDAGRAWDRERHYCTSDFYGRSSFGAVIACMFLHTLANE